MDKDKTVIVKNSLFSAIQIASTSLFLVAIYFIIITKLGKAQLGVWSIITSIPAAVSVFGSGVSGCILRYIPVYSAKNDQKAFNEIIFNGLIFNVLFGGVIVLIGYGFSFNILQFLFSKNELPISYIVLFRIALITFYVNFISSVIAYSLDGLQLIHLRNKIMIIGSIILFISVGFFINFWNLKGVLYAQLLQSIAILILVLSALIKTNLFNVKALKFNGVYLKLFLTYGQGFQFISISILIFEPITKYFLNKYFNLSTVGVYDLVNRIVIQTRTLIVSAVQVVTPMISEKHAHGNLDLQNIYNRTNRGAKLLYFSIFGTLICLSMIVVSYFDPDHIKQYFFMALLMSIAYHFNIVSATAYSILLGLGKLQSIIISHFISTFLNIILFLVLQKYLIESLIVLPVALSIIISAIYLINYFKRKMKIVNYKVSISDMLITILSLVTTILTGVVILMNQSSYFLVGLILAHSAILIYLMYYNDFFQTVYNKILNR